MKFYRIFSACLLSLLFTSLVLAQTTNDIPVQVQKLSDRVIVLTEGSPMKNNITAISSAEGLIIIDTSGSTKIAAKIRKMIEKEFNRKDFAYLINTHQHWDHTNGNQVFADAVIIAHEQCLEVLRQSDKDTSVFRYPPFETKAPPPPPNRMFTRYVEGLVHTPAISFNDRLTLDLGDLTLKLFYFGRAHSVSDIIIQVPEEGLLLTGDLFFEKRWLPLFIGQIELDVPRWIEVLNSVLDSEDKVKFVILGHQEIWSREQLVRWRDYIVKLWEGIVTAEVEGLDLEAVQDRFAMDERFNNYLRELGHNDAEIQRFQMKNIQAFWAQLKESAAVIVEQIIMESGIEAAIKKYNEIKSGPKGKYFIGETQFNDLGYRLIGARKIKDAIEVFKLNVEAFPESWNVYDSLGEAYMVNGDKELAIKNYKKSIELNPNNDNGKRIVKRLEGKK